jgi:hypothetical protein
MTALQITSRTKKVRSSSSGSKTIRFLEVFPEEAQMCPISHHRGFGKEGMHFLGSLEPNDGLRVHAVSMRSDTHCPVGWDRGFNSLISLFDDERTYCGDYGASSSELFCSSDLKMIFRSCRSDRSECLSNLKLMCNNFPSPLQIIHIKCVNF